MLYVQFIPLCSSYTESFFIPLRPTLTAPVALLLISVQHDTNMFSQ